MEIKPEHIQEAIKKFNGYWANDHNACDEVATKYGLDKSIFKSAVYHSIKEN